MGLLISDNYIVDTSIIYFVFDDLIRTYYMQPNRGYLGGGNVINAVGNYSYIGKNNFTLYLGSNQVPYNDIQSVNSSNIVFKAPAVAKTQVAYLYLVYGGVTFSNISAPYYYKNYSILLSIDPPLGPTQGGTQIVVRGVDFDQLAMCQIGNSTIIPTLVDSTYLLCETLVHKAAENVSFELTFEDGAYTTKTNLTFSYYNDMQTNIVLPQYISIYAGTNGVLVDVYGWGFLNNSRLAVRVADQIVPAQYLSYSHIQFTAINVLEEGSHYVFVANNGQDFQRGNNNLMIHFYKLLDINSVSPTKVQIGSQTTVITVTGYNFPLDTTLYCVFGRPDIAPYLQFNVEAVVLSDFQLECLAPSYEGQLDQLTSINLRVSYNLQEYYGLLKIPYFPAVTLTDFDEKLIIQTMSTVTIDLYGTNFMNFADETVCWLENYLKVRQKAFNIYFIDGEHIQCTFDMADIGFYNIVFSNNGVQLARSTAQLRVIDAIEVISVEPKLVLSGNKNQMIFVQATNLFDGCQCVFEGKNSEGQNVELERDFTLAKVINDKLMLCYVPNYSDVGSVVVNLRVSYGTYRKAQSRTSVLLTVVDKCPAGFGCQSYRVFECPLGHFCPGGGTLQAPQQCPIGYYQDQLRSSLCKPCPKGSFCPFIGLETPLPCPNGYICDREKLNAPNLECIQGSYCFSGTQTVDINEWGLLSTFPHKCTIGAYCKAGMNTGIVTFNTNTSTPAPCKRGMVCSEGSKDSGGVGPCPAGFFCPRPNITGIPCPPRHYCPDRGNTYPIKCPKGTFNFHFGAKNCTLCTIGRTCPLEGLNMPLLCPPGLACNKEGLIFPETLCRAGSICTGGVMTATQVAGRTCSIATSFEDCPYGTWYSKDVQGTFSAQFFPNYFLGFPVCCYNGSQIQDYIVNLGAQINSKSQFQRYGYIMNTTGQMIQGKWVWMWDGMRVIDKVAFKQSFNASDKLPIPNRKHRELLLMYFNNMYTKYMQQLCPGSFLCLDGVNTFTLGTGIISQPFSCPSGSFCQAGSASVIGSGLCPVGYYCPSGTSIPIPAQPGTFTSSPGAVQPQTCQPGTYAEKFRSTFCSICPNGFQCTKKGTVKPTICLIGNYRSVVQSNVCIACPRGTFSFDRGTRDILECLECPPGRMCNGQGLYNVSQSLACTDGQVCGTGTGLKPTVNCRQGFYCPPRTDDQIQYDHVCDQGFFCPSGTGISTKNRDTCPETYYCPPGTGNIIVLGSVGDYSTFAQDTVVSRCPIGTGNDGVDTKKSVIECYLNTNYTLLQNGISIRLKPSAQSSSQSSSPSFSRRLLQQEKVMEEKPSRMLVSQAELLLQAQQLKSLYEIQFALGQWKDQVRDNETPISMIATPIQNNLNLKRLYIARWCPLSISLISDYEEKEELSDMALQTNVPNAVFSLPTNAYALITIDLRHLIDESYYWTYGEDYEISFTMHDNTGIDDIADPAPMPEQFLSTATLKADVLEFQLLAMSDLRLRVDILLYNALYLNYKHVFVNSTAVEVRYPNRASYGSTLVFVASIVQDNAISLPINLPKLWWDGTSLPNYLTSFAYSRNDWNPIIHQSIMNRNIWVPSSIYWGSRSNINLNYLPYFSNCKGYGEYIPIWALMEQHQACTLIPHDSTFFMEQYSFGLEPIADVCTEALVECVIDEDISDQQPELRWFEVEASQEIFQISNDPLNFVEQLGASYDSTQVLSVFPSFEVDNTGIYARNVTFIISYYQVDKNTKRNILAELYYDNFKPLSETEADGTEKVYYNFTFSFLPLSHQDLTINFAFTSEFYILLYIIVNMISIIVTAVFVYYHRLVGRPPLNRPKFATFKFMSYLTITYKPAFYGTLLGLAPIVMGNLLITILISGHLMSIPTHLFSCDDPAGDSACVYTLFDMILDSPQNNSPDYVLLRTGRTGTAFLVLGAYSTIVSLIILIPDKGGEGRVPEAYDGNIWEFFVWKRSNIIYTSTFLILYDIALIQFSFSSIYGDNAWTMSGVFLVMQTIVETMIDDAIQEALLLCPLQVSFNVVIGLTGLGAENYFVFVQGYFVGMGITMFQRTYMDDIMEVVNDSLDESMPKIKRALIKWITIKDDDEIVKEDDGNEEDDDKGELKGDEKGEEEEEISDDEKESIAEIIYTDEDSLEDNMLDLSLDDDPNIILFQRAQEGMDMPEIDVSFEIRQKMNKDKEAEKKRKIELERYLRGKEGMEEAKKEKEEEFAAYQRQRQAEIDAQISDDEEAIKMDDADTQEIEPLIDYYSGFSTDTMSLIYQPFFTVLIWIYYDETIVADQYGIQIQNFVFYFLQSVVIIPFQMVIDILFQNLQEWYQGLPAHDYADFLAYRFKKRKTLWILNDGDGNPYVEESVRGLDQMCFSSQFYFIISLCASGFNQIVMGIQILVAAQGYNIFADNATIPIVFFMAGCCVFIHKLCIWLGQLFGIWHIQRPVDLAEAQKDNTDIGMLFDRVLDSKKYMRGFNKDQPKEVRFNTLKWMNADRMKTEEEMQQQELMTDRIVADTYRQMFMKHNKPWLHSQLYEIFTPRTLFLYRDQIIDQLRDVMGDIQVNISGDDIEKEEEKELIEDQEEEEALLGTNKYKFKKEDLDKVRKKASPITQAIIKFWIMRARFRQKVTLELQKVVDMMRKPHCLFCRTTQGVKVEIINNVEDLFYRFLKAKKQNLVSYKIVDWQRYFVKKGSTRTICQSCHRGIELYNKEIVAKLTQIRPAETFMEDDSKEERRKKVIQSSPTTKRIIRLWKREARRRLSLKQQRRQQQ